MADPFDGLLGVALRDREGLADAVEQLGDSLTPDLAEQAEAVAREAIQTSELERAEASYFVASMVHATLQNWPEWVRCAVQAADTMKVRAGTPDQYGAAHNFALTVVPVARNLKRPDLMFRAWATAADSAYFGAEVVKQEPEQERFWLLMTVDDCLQALEHIEAGLQTVSATLFVSLLAATTEKLMGQPWFDEEAAKVRNALRQFALTVESFLPVDAALSPELDSIQQLATVFARLSYAHGSPDAGAARLGAVIERAQHEGDLLAVMGASAARYEGERVSRRPSWVTRAQRLEMWTAVEHFREMARSRAGRLRAAQVLDEMTGNMVLDEVASLIGRDVEQAFTAMEMNKARMLLDELARAAHPFADMTLADTAATMEAELLRRPSALTDDLVGDEMLLLSRSAVGGLYVAPEKLQLLAEIEQLYASAGAGFVGSAAISDLDTVIGLLEAGEALVEYHIPYDALDPAGTVLVLFITAQGALSLHIPVHSDDATFIGRIQTDNDQPVDASPLGALIVNTRVSIQEGDDESAGPRLQELYRIMVGQLATYGISPTQFRRWIIVPHGILHTVPFAALRDPEGRSLVEHLALVIAPSSSVWATMRTREITAPQSFLGFADPPVPGFDALPDAVKELDAISSLLHVLRVVGHRGPAATEEAFRREAEGANLLHFATHGEFPNEDVMDMHRVLLAPDADHDGRVHAEELRQMNLAAALLVVLSICNGGLYRFGPGDEPLGLMSALLAAGARNVVGPLWEIDDELGSKLIIKFYERLLDIGPAEALRNASVEMMREGAEIRDWAGFVLVGDGRPFPPSR